MPSPSPTGTSGSDGLQLGADPEKSKESTPTQVHHPGLTRPGLARPCPASTLQGMSARLGPAGGPGDGRVLRRLTELHPDHAWG